MDGKDELHHVDVNLGGWRTKTKHAYTVEQAKEVHELLIESARQAMGRAAIQPRPLTLMAEDGAETVLESGEREPIYAPGWLTFRPGVGAAVVVACAAVTLAAVAGTAWMVAMAVGEVLG